MFLPGNVNERKKEDEERKDGLRRVEAWSMEMIPAEIRDDAVVSAREIICGDPACSPVDTAVTIAFKDGRDGIFGVPMEAKEVTKEVLKLDFPTSEVLYKWQRGEEAEWPPIEDDLELNEAMLAQLPKLRFEMGSRVLCHIGENAETDWAPGTVIALWYREPRWPPGSHAPYQVRLDDGREIFAPADMEQVIKAVPQGR